MAKKALGRGLEALFTEDVEDKELIKELKIIEIEPDKFQPRKKFDEESLAELADSIKKHGIIQPIIVKKQETGFYKIIAGERRWRAAKIAGLKEIPAMIKDYNENEMLEVSLIENIQRENLNPLEESEAYNKLINEFNLTQEEISERVGKSRSAIANSLRLLNLSDDIKLLITDEKLTGGHARALLSLADESLRKEAAEKIIKQGMSVREAEKYVKSLHNIKTSKNKEKEIVKNPYQYLEETLSKKLCTKVKIYSGKKRGKIEIEYYSEDELESITKIILGTEKPSSKISLY